MRRLLPDAPDGASIGLLGGSFNPPHAAHRETALAALVRLRLDRVWWLVSPGNPLKSHGHLLPLEQRVAAAGRLAAHPRMRATGMEAQLGTRYTRDTLAALHRLYPGRRFVWIMGADNLAQFHRWRGWRDIAATAPLAIVDRPGWRLPALSSPAARALARRRIMERDAAQLPFQRPPVWVFLTTRLSPLSSTALRGAATRAGGGVMSAGECGNSAILAGSAAGMKVAGREPRAYARTRPS